jgi:DNA processing protein
MEPARLRAILGRTPGLMARHLTTVTHAQDCLPSDLVGALLEGSLPARARRWLAQPDERLIDADLRWMQANETQVLTCLDPDYPPLLRPPHAPAALYVRGRARALRDPAVAIVGSRQASAAGLASAGHFATTLARAGVSIIGCLDEGIAAAAHAGALAGEGLTVAVWTAGLDRTPGRLGPLAARISERGCLVSQFGPGIPTRRHHFPLRNRLVAALATGTLVVEATAGGGALRTAAAAAALQRRVFALPGPIRDPLARPCNQLIRDGATLVQDPCDLLADLNININQCVMPPVGTPLPAPPESSPLDNKYEMLLDAAGFEPVDIDVLAFRTGWSGHAVAAMLLMLELQGRVAPQPGGRYCRLS